MRLLTHFKCDAAYKPNYLKFEMILSIVFKTERG